jgi:hypothetical protein
MQDVPVLKQQQISIEQDDAKLTCALEDGQGKI